MQRKFLRGPFALNHGHFLLLSASARSFDRELTATATSHKVRRLCAPDGSMLTRTRSTMPLYKGLPSFSLLSASTRKGTASLASEKKGSRVKERHQGQISEKGSSVRSRNVTSRSQSNDSASRLVEVWLLILLRPTMDDRVVEGSITGRQFSALNCVAVRSGVANRGLGCRVFGAGCKR